MPTAANTLLLLTVVVLSLAGLQQDSLGTTSGPLYTRDAQLRFPEHYREWTYLTSGFDMSYSADMQMGNEHMFDNVFVNPSAYAAFVKTGTWPDKTMLVLEHREAHGKGSINQRGNFQARVIDIEVHVKDEARFPRQWAFFAFGDGSKTSMVIPPAASCYACHSAHAAVDTTFVQFYPTLLPIAKHNATLSRAYERDMATASKQYQPIGDTRAHTTESSTHPDVRLSATRPGITVYLTLVIMSS